ncbi:MAG: alginate lyase family protein [Ignavibacteriae bacterium]|nr:hypothetical protein [Ignavibacteriota bacterium]NOH00043.1 alginate lyase family protein [Ignavibacteriota bacterium]
MITNKNIINRIKHDGFSSLVKSFYFNRIIKPYFKKLNRKKFSSRDKFLSNEIFFEQIKVSNKFPSKLIDSIKSANKKNALELLVDYIDNRKEPSFFITSLDDNLKTFYKDNYKDELSQTISKAKYILENRFDWITPSCPKFEDTIHWRKDFNSGKQWALTFFLDLDIFSAKRLGDARQLWELNRLQFLVTLGKAYFATGDEIYSKKYVDIINDWIKDNPCGYGINWHNSQESAIRLNSLIWSYYFFKSSKYFTTENKIELLKSIYQHAEFTYYKLSRNAVTHNHLISEICGLAMFSLMFPEFKMSKKWLRISKKIFEREVLKQIWESGPSGELSTNYHLFVLDSLIQTYILFQKNKQPVSSEVSDRIEKMIEYASFFIRPDGTIPKIGDNDSGRAFKLSEYDENDRRYYLSVGTVLFNQPNFKTVTKKFNEEAFWLMGLDGFNKFSSVADTSTIELSKYFEPTGFAIFRDGVEKDSTHICFRGGPTKLRKSVSKSHNHADFLSFELYKNGYTYLIDPGTYLYGLDDSWRFYFRKSCAHNTISIDDTDMVNVTASRFGISNLPTSTLSSLKTKAEFDYIEMSHNGYISNGIVHKRKFLFVKQKYLIIVDFIEGTGKHKIIQHFNIDNRKLNVESKNRKISLSLKNNSDSISICAFGDSMPIIDLINANLEPIDGWASDKYGEKHESAILRFKYDESIPLLRGVFIDLSPSSNYKFKVENLNKDIQKFKVESANFSDSIKIKDLTVNYTSTKKTNN